MLEVLRSGLHRVNNMRSGKLLAMETRNADQQTLDERELCGQQRKFLRHAGNCAREHPFFAIRELAANDGVDQVILKDVLMALKERLEMAIVRGVVGRSQALQSGAGAVADAGGECVDAFNKARPDV